MAETQKDSAGSKLFRLGPIEYVGVVAILGLAGAFFAKMGDKIDELSQAVPLMIEKQTAQGKDIDGLKSDVRALGKELTDMRIREAAAEARRNAGTNGGEKR